MLQERQWQREGKKKEGLSTSREDTEAGSKRSRVGKEASSSSSERAIVFGINTKDCPSTRPSSITQTDFITSSKNHALLRDSQSSSSFQGAQHQRDQQDSVTSFNTDTTNPAKLTDESGRYRPRSQSPSPFIKWTAISKLNHNEVGPSPTLSLTLFAAGGAKKAQDPNRNTTVRRASFDRTQTDSNKRLYTEPWSGSNDYLSSGRDFPKPPSSSSHDSGQSTSSSKSSFAYFLRESRSDLRLYHKRSKPSQHLREAAKESSQSIQRRASYHEPRVIEDTAAILAPPPNEQTPTQSPDIDDGHDRPKIFRSSAYHALASKAVKASRLAALQDPKYSNPKPLIPSYGSERTNWAENHNLAKQSPSRVRQLSRSHIPTPPEVEPSVSLEFRRSFEDDYFRTFDHPDSAVGPQTPNDVKWQDIEAAIATSHLSPKASNNSLVSKKRESHNLLGIYEQSISHNRPTLAPATTHLGDFRRSDSAADHSNASLKTKRHKSSNALASCISSGETRANWSSHDKPGPYTLRAAEDDGKRQCRNRLRGYESADDIDLSPCTTQPHTVHCQEQSRFHNDCEASPQPRAPSGDHNVTRHCFVGLQPTFELNDGKVYYKSPLGILNFLPTDVERERPSSQSTSSNRRSTGPKESESDFKSTERNHAASNSSDADLTRPERLGRRFAIAHKKSFSRLLQPSLPLKKLKSMSFLLLRKRKDPLEVTDFEQTSYSVRYGDALRAENNHAQALMRNPDIMDHDDDHDNESLSPFELDVPDHLPDSPLCPLSPQHRSGQKSICPLHRRKKSRKTLNQRPGHPQRTLKIVYDSTPLANGKSENVREALGRSV